ncbi:Carbonic anhydrase [Sergentomyia squamirostris]
MNTFIIVLSFIAFTFAELQDPYLDSSKNEVANDLDEAKEYEILMQKLGKTQNFGDFLENLQKSLAPRSGDHYGYEENSEYPPNRWSEKWATCGGIRQSPIDINLSSCQRDLSLFPLKFHNFDHHPSSMTVTNVGHSVQFSFEFKKDAPYLSRGILNSKKYILAQIHFHFGKTDDSGSEHKINSKSSALEMHSVFYKSTYADVSEASGHSGGLVVIGNLFEASDDVPNQFFVQYLSQVPQSGQSVTVKDAKGNRMIDFIGSLDFKYVRYEGSLTTPPCSEAVTWYVSTSVREISREDLANFRDLYGDEGKMNGNYRPVQAINGRKCYAH